MSSKAIIAHPAQESTTESTPDYVWRGRGLFETYRDDLQYIGGGKWLVPSGSKAFWYLPEKAVKEWDRAIDVLSALYYVAEAVDSEPLQVAFLDARERAKQERDGAKELLEKYPFLEGSPEERERAEILESLVGAVESARGEEAAHNPDSPFVRRCDEVLFPFLERELQKAGESE